MAEQLDVRCPEARAWLERVRATSARIEPLTREVRAYEAARQQILPWRSTGGGGSALHSDPTAAAAEGRLCELDALIADSQARLDAACDVVGACLGVLARMERELGERHARALEWYYVDRMPTWSEVARELRCGRTSLWQVRHESYAWIEQHCRMVLRA